MVRPSETPRKAPQNPACYKFGVEALDGHEPKRPDCIVVVDDDARIRDLLRRYLTQEGFEVLLAEDAKALNRVLTRETVDLIVLDLMLPGEDGLSICRRLRAANDVDAHHHADRQGEDVDRIVGPGGRRRRLPAQALQPARAAGAHPRRAAPPPAAGSARGAPAGDAGPSPSAPFEFDRGAACAQRTASRSR